jgi:transcriptional regulator with XRE-family HTH domain
MNLEQCRAARALLGWSTNSLADASNLGLATVRRFETGTHVQPASIDAMQKALGNAGITFIAAGEASRSGGGGVRLTSQPPGDEVC